MINVVGIPARLIPPYFADKTGPLNIVAPAVACLVVVTLSWLAVSSVTGLYVFTVFYGFVNAAFQCLIPSTVASLTPNMNMVGTRLGELALLSHQTERSLTRLSVQAWLSAPCPWLH